MCGIAAVFAYAEAAPPVDRDEVIRVRERMASRGPDDAGEWFSNDGRVGLGHRRLSIIDLSPAGAQPMFNADRSLAIIFNGEIYNYAELRSQLSANGYQFRSHCDTEVLLALYALRGERMLDELRGMYALAIWDERKQCLFLARDPFGIKPLYYSDNGQTLRVASQVKALRAGGNIDLAPDPAGHVGFFLWGHVPDPYTMFRNIRSLPAGHSMWVGRDGAHQPKCFCSISGILADAEASSSEHALGAEARSSKTGVRGRTPQLLAANSELLRTALRETVRYHLVADVPVGVFLSSGLDSTMITALAAEQGGILRTVTLGFEEYKGTAADEVPLAEEFAKRCGANHQTIWVSRGDFEAERDHLFEAMDRPSTDGVNTFFVSLAAKQANLKVALSGLGGDELFASYPSFKDIPRTVRLFKPFAPYLPTFGRELRMVSAPVIKRFTSPKYAGLFEYGGSYSGAYLLRRGMFMPWELPELLDADFVREGWRELQTLLRLDETLDGIKNPRLKVSALEMNWYMRHQLLRDSDWAGMGHSVEIRVPFVDVALLKQLAPILVRQSAPTKRQAAASASKFITSEMLGRPKTGFQVPVRDWLMSQSRYGSFKSRRQIKTRGLRGWAQEVYSQFMPTGRELSGDLIGRRKRAADSTTSGPAKLQILMLLSDGFGGFGGIAKFNRDFMGALSSSNDVAKIVAVPRLMQEDPGDLPPKLAYATGGLGGKQHYLRAVLRAARELRAAKTFSIQPVIICGHINLLPAAIAARRMTGAELYLIVHGIDAWQPTRDSIANACVRYVDDFISVSAVTRRRFLQWSGLKQNQGLVLPNCVDLEAFRPAPKSVELVRRYSLERARVLVTLGRLASEERYKGFDEIIECLPDIGKEVRDVVYLVVGDGPDRLRLVEKARSLGLQVEDYVGDLQTSNSNLLSAARRIGSSPPRVIFVGKVDEKIKADYLRLADLFVMPSSGEGFGIVLLEAMACGIPVIGSKIDGSREALRDGELGKLVDPRNLSEIKQAVIECLTSPTIDRTQPIPGVEYFSTDQFERRVHQIIREIRGAQDPLADDDESKAMAIVSSPEEILSAVAGDSAR